MVGAGVINGDGVGSGAMPLALSAGDVAYWALAIFLVLLGVGSLFALIKLGQLFDRISGFVGSTERDVLPVVVKTGGTVDRVNYQLDKLDTVTDSAVSMADSADTAVRAVSTAISKPVEKVSGMAAGIAHGVSTLKKRKKVGDAMDAAKDAARRREQDLHEDLRSGSTPMSTDRPTPTPTPAPTPKPRPLAAAGADAEAGSRLPFRPTTCPDAARARRPTRAERRAGYHRRMRTTAELREGFLSFFEEREHLRFPSFPLLPPPEDPSTLFISAGMQPLKPYFSGLEAAACATLHDRPEVPPRRRQGHRSRRGRLTARHASMFEMLGNFSFGDYFKDGAVDYAWEFVTERLGFEPERLWASVFAGDPGLGLGEDDVAVQAWLRKGLPRERIVPFPRSENFWGPAGETGPCGPCSELHYDRGAEHGCGEPDCGPNCARCDRYIEFWNLVFMEFDLAADGSLTPLPKQNIDTGMGLERCAMLVQDVETIFDTDGFRLIMDWIEAESGVTTARPPRPRRRIGCFATTVAGSRSSSPKG